jgi:hypothetical protein
MEFQPSKRLKGLDGHPMLAFRTRHPDTTPRLEVCEYQNPIILNNLCRQRGFTPYYSFPPAGMLDTNWFGRLVLDPFGEIFEHRRAEKKQKTAKKAVAAMALRFLAVSHSGLVLFPVLMKDTRYETRQLEWKNNFW